MSSTTRSFTEEQQPNTAKSPQRSVYVPTEEEMAMLTQCNTESIIYRGLPFSVVSMALTHALVARGSLSASPRYGSLPKVLFAGFCGYMAGKLSYIKTCQEKFKKMDSPIGEMLRQSSRGKESELSDPDTQSFGAMFQPAEAPSNMSVINKDNGYGYNPEPPVQTGRADDFSAPAQSYVEEDQPRKKHVFYEELRLKNRENYEVTLTQKADSMLKPPHERGPERPKKDVKKNIYGDTWEE